MESVDLLRRLERRESDLSFRITHLRKELDDLETAVTRISIAREEVQALEAIGELSSHASLAAPVDNTAVASSLEIGPMQLKPERPAVGPVSDQIVTLLASNNRVWRANEVADALGIAGRGRTRVESTRSKLERLVELGIARKIRPGRFVIATAPTIGVS